jgi:putative lipoic acid-binding regulatory protein
VVPVDTTDTLLEFPVDFPIKAMGRQQAEFRDAVLHTIHRHADVEAVTEVREQVSRNGNFVSVTVTFTAHSKAQLDAIYQALHDHELVMMVF